MPMVTFDKKYLSGLAGGLSDQKLDEEIGKLGVNVEKIDKNEISVEVSSNRPDLISAVGLARALQLYSHRSKKYYYSIRDNEPLLEINVGRDVGGIRPYIASFAAVGLHFTEDSLTELIAAMDKFTETFGRGRRKIAIGMHNLGAVKGPLSYDAYSDGKFVPLNSTREMSYEQVLKETEKGSKYADTIPASGKRRLYPALKDTHGTLALIPVLNTERTKVTASTKNVLVDITGPSEYMVNRAADLFACVFMDMGAEVKKVQVNYPDKGVRTPLMEVREILVPAEDAEMDIGVKIGQNNVASLAAKMGYDAAYIGNTVRFRVPPYRVDVINEQDIIEDIAIAYGYDYINPLPVKSIQTGSLDQHALYRSNVSELMIGMGFNQMMNSYLSNDKLNFGDMRLKIDKSAIRIKNPKTEVITIMRTWILPSLLRNVSLSLNEKTPLNVFELDMVFSVKNGNPNETYHLAAVSSDPRSNFNSMKSVFENLSFVLGMKFKLEKYSHNSFMEGRCAKIVVEEKELGFFGELHPQVLNAFGIEEPTTAIEIQI